MNETITAATALGHPIEHQYADLQIERTYPMGAYQPSTLVDWLAGRELEIEAMWGEPLRRAKGIGLSLPHLRSTNVLGNFNLNRSERHLVPAF
jgi:2-dehydropantoate 2-reductase